MYNLDLKIKVMWHINWMNLPPNPASITWYNPFSDSKIFQ